MTKIGKLHAKRQVSDALQQRNGPQTLPTHDIPIGSLILVWRTHQNAWTGPFKLISTQGETCTIDMPNGPTDFCTTMVKPYITEQQKDDTLDRMPHQDSEPHQDLEPCRDLDPHHAPELRHNPPCQRQLPMRYQNIADVTIYHATPTYSPQHSFEASRK